MTRSVQQRGAPEVGTKKMGRVLVVGMLVLAIVMVLATTAVAKPFAFAVGSGLNAAGEKFSFFAYEGPNGPSGYAKIKFPPSEDYPLGFEVQGHVSCFEVLTRNTARFGFEIEKGTGSIPSGSEGFQFYIEDNGKPGDQNQDIMGTGFNPTVPKVCPPQGGATPIVKGDIKIHTAR